jgi:hypothetical protein
MISPGFHGSFTIGIALSLLAVSSPAQDKYQTIGMSSCGTDKGEKCHGNEYGNWYKNDPHKATLDMLADDQAKSDTYAEKMGIGAANLYKGKSLCMSCHGTVVTGKENQEAEDGVSCESCHGPASGYREPHQEGTGRGAQRPGYLKAVKVGMRDFKGDKNLVATTCVGCHYITNDKLRSAGHSSGSNFNYISGIKKVAKHWKRPPGDDDLERARFENAKKQKSPGGLAQLPPVQGTPDVQIPVGETRRPQPVAVPPQPPSPAAIRPVPQMAPSAPLNLPPFPAITDSTSLDSLLLILKQRLQLLYKNSQN